MVSRLWLAVVWALCVGRAPSASGAQAEGDARRVRLPLAQMLKATTVRVASTRADIGGPRQVLGSSAEGMCRFVEQPAHVTVVFPKPVRLRGARVRFSHHGGRFRWSVQCADDEADLETRKASFREALAERTVGPDTDDAGAWGPIEARAWRLVCGEDGGDSFVHLRRFELLCSEHDYLSLVGGGARFTGLRLLRDDRKPLGGKLTLPGNQPLLVAVEGTTADGKTYDLTGAARLAVSRPQVLEVLDGAVLVPRETGAAAVHAEIGSLRSPSVAIESPSTPDLIVLAIERTPRYPKYHPRYQNFVFDEGFAKQEASFVTGLEDAQAQRWPKAGDEVTFTASVFNRGNVGLADFVVRWRLDGREVHRSEEQALGPGKTLRTMWTWRWTPERHVVEAEAAWGGDATPRTNRLARATDALELLFLVEEGYRLRFAARTPRVKRPATASAAKWIHHHVGRFNAMFEERHCKTRIAVGRLDYIADGAPDLPAAVVRTFDGRFPTRFTATGSDWRLGGSGYYRPAVDIDCGFLHELGHQLGLIDLYRLNLERSQNKVTGTLYRWGDGLMCNCAPILSEFSARALDAWHGHRRGYYGQYLYDLPETVVVRLLGPDGKPLARRPVRVYQKIMVPGKGEQLCPKPRVTGATDGKGELVLPNVPVDRSRAKPVATGNVLRPNPWGHVACVAFNGLFLVEAETAAGKLYGWLPITEANLAYWRGERKRAVLAVQMRALAASR